MKVKYNFSKDATALLLGCLCLLGTSLQAQFGGDELEQVKPPYRLHHFGRLESQRIEVSAEPRGDKILVTGELHSTVSIWFSPTSSKENRLVYRQIETSSTGFGVSDIVSIIKNWDPSSPENSYYDNFRPIKSWSIIINLYRDGDGTYRQEVMPGLGNSMSKRLLRNRRFFRGIPEMPHYVGWVSDASAATTTIQTPEGPIKHPHITQSTSTSTRSVEVFNHSGQPIRLALTLPYTDRCVPWFTDQYKPTHQWKSQKGVWSSQPFAIPVGASTTLDMALPQGWRAGKFLPESITILSGGGAGGGPGLPGM